ncbi:hypothetical protein Ddc_07866 [Ditylenchus destructor]|nr:hypothetical protein Ddc_07866 [Ditylenchus destructor]
MRALRVPEGMSLKDCQRSEKPVSNVCPSDESGKRVLSACERSVNVDLCMNHKCCKGNADGLGSKLRMDVEMLPTTKFTSTCRSDVCQISFLNWLETHRQRIEEQTEKNCGSRYISLKLALLVLCLAAYPDVHGWWLLALECSV